MLSRFYSWNWVKFYDKFIEFKMNEERNEVSLTKDDLYIVNVDGKVVQGVFKMYRYVDQDREETLVKEIYFVFFEDKESKEGKVEKEG